MENKRSKVQFLIQRRIFLFQFFLKIINNIICKILIGWYTYEDNGLI